MPPRPGADRPETWWSTVRTETTSGSAISEFVRPSPSSRRISTWRSVSPGIDGWTLCGPRGNLSTPRARNRRRAIRAAGSAPSSSCAGSTGRRRPRRAPGHRRPGHAGTLAPQWSYRCRPHGDQDHAAVARPRSGQCRLQLLELSGAFQQFRHRTSVAVLGAVAPGAAYPGPRCPLPRVRGRRCHQGSSAVGSADFALT